MRIAIAGGGTGGHISPAIAVAESLRSLDPAADIHFLGTPRPVDARMYAPFGETFHVLHPPRVEKGPAGLFLLPVRSLASYREALTLLRRLRPDVLFGTGGYPSFFPVLASRTLGIPSAIHESNGVPGKANLLASLVATLVLTGSATASEAFRVPVRLTGNPVRHSLRPMDRISARLSLGLPEEGITVLFLGGSQGAHALNAMVPLAPAGISVVVQCGASDEERVRLSCKGMHGTEVRVVGFTDDPSTLYSAADVAVARAGAMTIAELAWFRLPSVLVPYPSAAGDHQRINAEEAAAGGGAVVLAQDRLEEDLWDLVSGLAADAEGLAGRREALARTMPSNPADAVAALLLDLARGASVGRRGRGGPDA